jgi:hypothetical protein
MVTDDFSSGIEQRMRLESTEGRSDGTRIDGGGGLDGIDPWSSLEKRVFGLEPVE